MTNNTFFELWWSMVKSVPTWEWTTGILVFCSGVILLCVHELFKSNKTGISQAFEKIKFKEKDVDRELANTVYFEIAVPKDSQATAFQVQQKILKALHSVYADVVEGPHGFSSSFYFFQKLVRSLKVRASRRPFFTLQVWSQYPYISFRLYVPLVTVN